MLLLGMKESDRISLTPEREANRIHQVLTFVRECCPLPCPPLNVSAHIQHQVLHVALPGAEEVASVISIAGVQTVLVAGYRDQEVGGNTTTPAQKDHISILFIPSWPSV